MIKYIIFTEDELDNIKNGIVVIADDTFGKIEYVSEEYYERMMNESIVKEQRDGKRNV